MKVMPNFSSLGLHVKQCESTQSAEVSKKVEAETPLTPKQTAVANAEIAVRRAKIAYDRASFDVAIHSAPRRHGAGVDLRRLSRAEDLAFDAHKELKEAINQYNTAVEE